ncbi:MAG: XRE family transcriptional regulator [Candidatus Cloacimonadota bacterium]|nr:MAG: XRE family transcriptional regulator [Candidatus Cloacimonadota bacterium]
MSMSYKKLWKLLIDLDMNQNDLVASSGVSRTILANMKKGLSIRTDTIEKFCEALNCQPGDIMEYIPNNI